MRGVVVTRHNFFACCMHVSIEMNISMISQGGESHRFYPDLPTPNPFV